MLAWQPEPWKRVTRVGSALYEMPFTPDWVTSKQEQSAGIVRVASMSTAEVALHRLYSVTAAAQPRVSVVASQWPPRTVNAFGCPKHLVAPDVIDGRAAVVVGVATEDPAEERKCDDLSTYVVCQPELTWLLCLCRL